MAEVIMPKMGDAMDTGVIVQWLKNVGDKVTADDAIAEIETDKSNVEVTADNDGYITEIKAKPGETIPVGQVIAIIGAEAGAASSAPAPEKPQAPAQPQAQAKPEAKPETPAQPEGEAKPGTPDKEGDALAQGSSTITDVKTPDFTEANGTQTHAPADAPTAPKVKKVEGFKPYSSFVGALPEGLGGSSSVIGEPVTVEGEDDGVPSGDGGEKVKATPLARAMADAHKLNLNGLRGSGPDGAIGKKDVEAALAGTSGGAASAQSATPSSEPGYGLSSAPTGTESAAPASAPAKAATPAPAPTVSEGDEVQEYNAMRRTIAKRLAESKSTIPHFYVTVEIDVEAMLALREQVNATAGEGGTKVTVNDFLVKATAAALGENPLLNSSFADNKRTIKKAVNIGIAVSLADGLIVPVVKDCGIKSIRQIAKETRPLIDKARNGKLGPADYSGGTFTISNLGSLSDVENFAAIVNPGEGAILAIASARQVPAVVNGELAIRKRMKVTLSADHRVVDGSDGAKFLTSLKRIIENPLEILA